MSFTSISSNGRNDRFVVGYQDALGDVRTALSGSAVYVTETIYDSASNSTGIILPCLRHDQDDFTQIILQFNHSRQPGSALADLHVHYIPLGNGTGNIYWQIKYCWTNFGDTISNTNFTTVNATTSVTNGAFMKSNISVLLSNIAAPASDAYSSILFVQITRLGASNTNDTYITNKSTTPAPSLLTPTANLAIMYIDAHYAVDRVGSYTSTRD